MAYQIIGVPEQKRTGRWHIRGRCGCGVERFFQCTKQGKIERLNEECKDCRNARRRTDTAFAAKMSEATRVHGHSSRHGTKESRTHQSWSAMLNRCRNPNAKDYARWGGSGITVCDRWQGKKGFLNFLADMGERPEGMTLDRFPDKTGNYEPGNCRWATLHQQANNRIDNIILVVRGEQMTIAEASVRFGIPHDMIDRRIRKGWSVDRAVFEPIHYDHVTR